MQLIYVCDCRKTRENEIKTYYTGTRLSDAVGVIDLHEGTF